MGSLERLLVLVFVMKATVTCAGFVLLSIITCLQKVNGDYQNNSPLQIAVINNNVDLVKSLLANDSDVKATNDHGDTALMTAAGIFGSSKMVELVLPYSDVKATDNFGYTALMYAAMSENEKSVELLLPNSDVKATNVRGETALMHAAMSGNEKSVELLLPNSDVEAINRRGNTALGLAKALGRNQIVSLLQQQA